MSKKITSIFLIYFLQFIITSCCNCDPVLTYEKTYNGVEIKSWDTSGFRPVSSADTVYKNSFGITVETIFDLNEVAYNQPAFDLSSFGYSSAYATSCDCLPHKYIDTDPIILIVIQVTDTETQETINVTNNFTIPGYGGESLSINDLFEQNPMMLEAFQADMTKIDNIPDKAIFTVKYYLESGAELVDQTQEIIFQ
ncbi:hypothetical protein OO013_15635 [Mangrovivirga sp. M17]|uniref:DUF5034 domain-containing protein n=1 Tax=Mangrovivirga halotolerans TaxID=2993936 RepID=A0ABT3RU51_9BACT|nr:hypothetical protein [Mangrovivirga halotolerans]MCX2745309.1 hypothetical protein [Mangrovivirga halotolerans]